MRTFSCTCGNRVFFENSRCLACHRELAWCPGCQAITSIETVSTQPGQYSCSACYTFLRKCHNYEVEGVCNRTIVSVPGDQSAAVLCDYCRFNDTIPDLSIPVNRQLWYRLEKAKRRLLYTLDLLGLAYGSAADGFEPPLSFDFKGDIEKQGKWWWRMGQAERVFTGHANGKITINIREADEVHRVKARVSFEEAHRTEIGHFRHEMGHYYWDLLVADQCEEAFKSVFGDHENPTYSDSLQRYYEEGCPVDWEANYITAYATMHPWEDFAESFATYLDIVSVLDTARNMNVGSGIDPLTAGFDEMYQRYIELGVVLNEMNRAQGLLDLVPEVLNPSVVGKLEFVHRLLRAA